MMNNNLQIAEQIILLQLEEQKKKNLRKLLDNYIDPITRKRLTGEEKLEIFRNISEINLFKITSDNAIVEPANILKDKTKSEPWYDEWISKNKGRRYYWDRLKHFLGKKLTDKYGGNRAGTIVQSIDKSSDLVLSNLEDPTRPQFLTKGLVIGYVQSGKTANFTALISKAADAGYKLIVVLAGIHDVLRLQTQLRLDKELTGIDDRNIEPRDFISLPSEACMWQRLTTAQGSLRGGEFTRMGKDPFTIYCHRTGPILAVIKKNCSVMDNLINWLKSANEDVRQKVPLLLIDDEADQASINTNIKNPETDPSKTNKRIIKLLALFTKAAYVGYTATPFANVLIDAKRQIDLYPRNFIISLPEPKGYMGAAKIFQSSLSNNFIRVIPDEQVKEIMPQKFGSIKIPQTLVSAVYEFILCCCIRCQRGDSNEPMSMLIHIKHTTPHQTEVKDKIDDLIQNIITEYKTRKGNQRLMKRFRMHWDIVNTNVKEVNSKMVLKSKQFTFKQAVKHLKRVLAEIQIVELNYKSEDKLDYTSSPKPKVIAIGGNQLSRGLTLEGLMCSYYLRLAKQYDTLLQMGRWFGYREKYEDLTRVFTSNTIRWYYVHLATVEDEIRKEISRYEEEKLTPKELAIVIRSHPNLNITAPNKMGAGVTTQSSFSGRIKQTFYMQLDNYDILRYNLKVGENFIQALQKLKKPEPAGESRVWKKVDASIVISEFLNKYSHKPDLNRNGSGFDHSSVINYIERRLRDNELAQWNVALISRAEGYGKVKYHSTINFSGYKVNKVHRSRFKDTTNGYNIGVLSNRYDTRISVAKSEKENSIPLLLIYIIAKESKANPKSGDRVALFDGIKGKHEDVLGFAIQFPVSKREPFNYVGQIIT